MNTDLNVKRFVTEAQCGEEKRTILHINDRLTLVGDEEVKNILQFALDELCGHGFEVASLREVRLP